jgi:splicing factor 3B subunit 3
VDPVKLETLFLEEFEGTNEVIFSHFISTTLGGKHSTDTFLIVGTGVDVKFSPRTCALGFIKTYRFTPDCKRLELVHSTPCEDIPLAFAEYKGKLIAGVGCILRVYEMGIKKLLRKVENKNFQAPIIKIEVEEESGRIFAGDL